MLFIAIDIISCDTVVLRHGTFSCLVDIDAREATKVNLHQSHHIHMLKSTLNFLIGLIKNISIYFSIAVKLMFITV